MAREQRKDVDYFPHDCTHGRKMHIIEAKYGNDGYSTWFKLLEQLGKANNHYIDVSDEMTLMFLTSLFKVSEEKTVLILNDLAKLGAIDKKLWSEYRVIFSQKFTDGVQDAYRKRKMKCYQYSDVLNEIDPKAAQSSAGLPPKPFNTPEVIPKVKESKVKESKVEKSKVDIVDRKLKFSSTLEPFLETYGRELLKEFNGYWTESNKSNTKFKYELEKTWDTKRRLETWAKNDKNFSNGKSNNKSGSKANYEFSVDRITETYASKN
jgi:hypothetical protein